MNVIDRNATGPVRIRLGGKSRRGGFTLIELVLVLTLTSALLGGVIGLMSIARGSDQQSIRNLVQRQEIRRFADDIRRDLRRSENSALTVDEFVLSDASQNRRILYQIDSGSTIIRTIRDDNDLVVLRDKYSVGNNARIEVDWLEDAQTIRWAITEADRPNHPIQIIAAGRSTP